MITTMPLIIFSRHCKLPVILAALLITNVFSYSAHSGIRRFPEANVVRGRTAGGHAYLSGGISFEEQRAIERVSHLYNLKIVFARPVGTLTVPIFLMIGSNNTGLVEKISPRAPWFYIRLPSGGYTILARFKHEVVLVRDVYLGEGQRKTYFLRGN
jgi:hypothetical protein